MWLLKKVRLLRRCDPPKKIDGFCSGRIEIAAVAALLRNDISWLFSFIYILRIRSGAPNDNSVFETKTGFLLFLDTSREAAQVLAMTQGEFSSHCERFEGSRGNLKSYRWTFSTTPLSIF